LKCGIAGQYRTAKPGNSISFVVLPDLSSPFFSFHVFVMDANLRISANPTVEMAGGFLFCNSRRRADRLLVQLAEIPVADRVGCMLS
jgi:hypothetical protein